MIELTQSYAYFRANPKPYYQKKFVQKVVERSDLWVRKWSKILIEEVEFEDFATHYKSRSGLNFHQACVLGIISDWRYQYPSISDEQLIEIIIENLDELTIETILADSSTEYEPEEPEEPSNLLLAA